MKTRKDFKGNVWRHLLADAIEANGGYSRGYHDRYALSWDVGVYESVPDFDDMLKAVIEEGNDHGITAATPLDPELLEEMKEQWDDEQNQYRVWDRVVEDMRSGVTDADTYRTLRPEIAARYGLGGSEEAMPRRYKRRTDECAYHPASKPGWIKVDPYRNIPMFDVKWEFAGRGGKHLCLAEFEGQRLDVSSESLAETIREADDRYGGASSFPDEWCQKLLAFIHECDLCFTSKAIKDEFQYQLRWLFANDLEEVAEATEKHIKEAAEVQYWNARDICTLP